MLSNNDRPVRVRRSELSTPASRPDMIAKAARSDADLVMLDLEDAVPVAQKVAARTSVVSGLQDNDWSGKVRAYRINPVHSQWCLHDVIDVVSLVPDLVDIIVVPKVRTSSDVRFIDELLTHVELSVGAPTGRIGLEVMIEEAEALATVEAIATSSPRLEALILGMGDLAASLGMRLTHIGVVDGWADSYTGDLWHAARWRMITAARAAGLDAIDGPYANFGDAAGFEASARGFAVLGGSGKWCIHPNQISSANAIFSPSAEEVERAHSVISAMNDAARSARGAVGSDGMMLDHATVRMAEATLQRAAACDNGR